MIEFVKRQAHDPCDFEPAVFSYPTLCYSAECFFFLRIIAVPVTTPPLINSNAIHNIRLLLSPVCGDFGSSGSLAVTVAALVISLVAAASAKYLPQFSQCQNSILPSASLVTAFVSICRGTSVMCKR